MANYIKLLVVAAIVGLVPSVTAAIDLPRLAVLDVVDSASCLSAVDERQFNDAVRRRIRHVLPADKCIVITRDNIYSLLPQGVRLTDLDGQPVIEIGRRIEADYIVTSEIQYRSYGYSVSFALYETGSANLVISKTDAAVSFNNLLVNAESVLPELVAEVVNDYDERERRALEATIREVSRDSDVRADRLILGSAVVAGVAAAYFYYGAGNADAGDQGEHRKLGNIALGVASSMAVWYLIRK